MKEPPQIPGRFRYIQSDPIGQAGGANTYSYVLSDPIQYIDSKGLVLETIWDLGNLAYDVWNQNWEDAAWDALAICIPGVPAGATKIAGLAKRLKPPLGFDRIVKDPPFNPHGQKVFTDGKTYVTRDIDQHNGGVWKQFDRQGRRMGTYDANMNRIGK